MTIDLQTMQRKLGGSIYNNQLYCPGPLHSQSDRSLSIKLSATAPDGFVLNCFSPKDDPLKCLDYVRSKLGLPQWQPATNTERALKIWNEAQDPRSTAAEQYLLSRKLILAPELCGSVLRFHWPEYLCATS